MHETFRTGYRYSTTVQPRVYHEAWLVDDALPRLYFQHVVASQ